MGSGGKAGGPGTLTIDGQIFKYSALWFVLLMPSQTTLKTVCVTEENPGFLTWCFCQKEKAMLKCSLNKQNMKTKVENNVVHFKLKTDEIRRFYFVIF